MLRKTTILLSAIVVSWWVASGDTHALKRSILELRDGQTQFTPDEAAQRSDWG